MKTPNKSLFKLALVTMFALGSIYLAENQSHVAAQTQVGWCALQFTLAIDACNAAADAAIAALPKDDEGNPVGDVNSILWDHMTCQFSAADANFACDSGVSGGGGGSTSPTPVPFDDPCEFDDPNTPDPDNPCWEDLPLT